MWNRVRALFGFVWVLGFALSSAHAERPRAPHAEAGDTIDAEAGEVAEGEGEEAEEEPPLALGLDLVIGFGKFAGEEYVELLEGLALPGAREVTTRVTTESLVLAAGYEIAEHIGLGVRLPLILGTLDVAGDSRSHFVVGNVEIEGEYGLALAPQLRMAFSLGISVPTAQGVEEPREGDSRSEIERGMIQKAAASSRGFEDEALFEVNRFGINPKVSMDYRYGHFLLRPYVKMENLISTEKEAEHRDLIEILIATYIGVALGDHVDLGTRVWTDLVLTGSGDSVGIVEPQLAVHAGAFRAVLGGIIPFAGKLTDPLFGGIRLALVARL